MEDSRSDEELMAAYVAGQPGAFDVLFARYSGRLERALSRDLPRPEEVRDLVQQSFLHLHRARFDFRAGSRVRPWLYTIALNLKRQRLRALGRKPETPLADPSAHAGADDDPESSIDNRRVRAAIEALPPRYREVIELHWFEGLSYPEVAEVVGATTAAVKVRADRGYTRLREILGERPVTPAAEAAYSAEE